MGKIVGAAIVSHVPPLVLPKEVRLELNNGKDFSIVEGLHRLRTEQLDRVAPDSIIVFDTHWYTTFEHIVTAHARRTGRYTSDELPRGNPAMPYDLPGDPELAEAIAAAGARRDDTYVHATSDPYIGIHYPTVYLTPFLQGDERWLSAGICQTATPADFLLFGELIAEAVAELDRRVVLLASGGLSHTFWPLRELRNHEAASLEHIISPEACSADQQLIELLEAGDHAAVLARYDEYRRFSPEGMFAHYLMMVGALGGAECTAKGTRYSDYESAAGTGQVHIWFDTTTEGQT
ncbi:MAG: 3,4-dihydroxyphenylacetate 2,3-dioxygenase [Ilumatobacteraceae bacterium]